MVAPVTDYASAMASVVDRNFLGGPKHKEQQTRAVRNGVHPHILAFSDAFARRMSEYGVPVYAHCMVRSHAEQQKVFDGGFSRSLPGQSAHNWGLAVDIVHGTRHWDMDRKAWECFGHIGQELAKARGWEISWGGFFKSPWDPAHWQITNWRSVKDKASWPIGA